MGAGGEEQDLSMSLSGPREPGDDDLVYLWVRRPVIEWALRRAAGAQAAVELRSSTSVAGLLTSDKGSNRAVGVVLANGEEIRGDVVVDALGRYRCPSDWPRRAGTPKDCGAVYYCRYYELADGVEHLGGGAFNPLNPRGDLGYMGFNTFRGDNRTYAVILLAPGQDRDLRVLRHEEVWTAACSAMRPLDVMTSPDYGRPITGVMPMGGLMNVDRTGDTSVRGVVAVGDALCHTDPAFAWGLSFALAHAEALARATTCAPDVDAVVDRYQADVTPEARERYELACAMDDARNRRWQGETLDITRRDGCYPLFSSVTALVAAAHDDLVLRRAIGRIGLLDRTAVFDEDEGLHDRIETTFARVMAKPPPPAGPPRDELLERLPSHTAT